MRTASETVIRAWLVDGATDADFFLADVWRMLGAIAGREGCDLAPHSGGPRGEYRAALRGLPPEALSRECGVHRAQWVPPHSYNGRIETSLVGVEILSGDGPTTSARPSGQVLKTYNYLLHWVVFHASGEKLPFEVVFQ